MTPAAALAGYVLQLPVLAGLAWLYAALLLAALPGREG